MNPSLESIIGSKWDWSHLEIILRGSCKQSLNKCFSLQLYVNARYLEISTVVQYGLPKILEWLFILCSHTNDNLYFYLLYLKLIYVTDMNKIYNKAAGKLKMLLKIRNCISTHATECVYKHSILPFMTYCWVMCCQASESTNKRFKRLEDRAKRIIIYHSEAWKTNIKITWIENHQKNHFFEKKYLWRF